MNRAGTDSLLLKEHPSPRLTKWRSLAFLRIVMSWTAVACFLQAPEASWGQLSYLDHDRFDIPGREVQVQGLASRGGLATFLSNGLLYVTDGHQSGTEAIAPGARVVASSADQIWLTGPAGLWLVDTSVKERPRLTHLREETISSFADAFVVNDRLLFVESGQVVSGTLEGLGVLATEPTAIKSLGASSSKLFFLGASGVVGATDGTAAGTTFHPAINADTVFAVTPSGGYFLTWLDGARRLIYSDGTDAGTVLIGTPPISSREVDLVSSGPSLFLTLPERPHEIWKVAEGATEAALVATLPPPFQLVPPGSSASSIQRRVVEVGSTVYFLAQANSCEPSIWSAQVGGDLLRHLEVDRCLFGEEVFVTESATHAFVNVEDESGDRLWQLDGNSGNATVIGSSGCIAAPCLLVVEGMGILETRSGSQVNYVEVETGRREIWSERRPGGYYSEAVLVGDRLVVNSDNELFFVDRQPGPAGQISGLSGGSSQLSLGSSFDGLQSVFVQRLSSAFSWLGVIDVENGTFVEPTASPTFHCFSQLVSRTAEHGTVVACDETLSFYDGEGTFLQTLMLPGEASISTALAEHDRTLVGVPSAEDSALVSTDGTPGGTEFLPIGRPLRLSSQGLGYFQESSVDNSTNSFFATDGTTAGTQILETGINGTPAFARTARHFYRVDANGRGLVRIDRLSLEHEFLPNLVPFAPFQLIPFGDTLLLVDSRLTESEIWSLSDSATAPRSLGVVPAWARFREIAAAVLDEHAVLNFQSGGIVSVSKTGNLEVLLAKPDSDRSTLQAADNGNQRVFFSHYQPETGFELWVSDGTRQGTRLAQDLLPGPASSSPSELATSGGNLFFLADDGIHGYEVWRAPLGSADCVPAEHSLCLQQGRFKVDVAWVDFQGGEGRGVATPLTADTGHFWFFTPENIELIIKVLDGRTINDHFWTFFGALSNVEYLLTITDTETGLARRYGNHAGTFASIGDTTSIASDAPASRSSWHTQSAAVVDVQVETGDTAPCVPTSTTLCLADGRFEVQIEWLDFFGGMGAGQTRLLTSDTGSFWFFDQSNLEVVVKVIDGRPLNGHFWIFFGSLSNVEFSMTIRDTETGVQRNYFNPLENFASVGDTAAFRDFD